jgi:hypothetical protein
MKTQLSQLKENGYCVFDQALEKKVLEKIKRVSRQALEELTIEHRKNNKSQGSLIMIADYPDFGMLIGNEELKEIFRKLGFDDTRFSSGYIISKPNNSPALFWHQDWWGWDHPLSYTNQIAQVFVMIYLQDTNPQNGCLRVIPRSHRSYHALHSNQKAHTESASRVEDPNDSIYNSLSEEVPVPVKCGDVIVGDARLIHGSFPNQSEDERTLITLWYHPHYNMLPGAMQSRICEIFHRKGVDTDPDGEESMTLLKWPERFRKPIEALFPSCPEDAEPYPWCRIPSWSQSIK